MRRTTSRLKECQFSSPETDQSETYFENQVTLSGISTIDVAPARHLSSFTDGNLGVERALQTQGLVAHLPQPFRHLAFVFLLALAAPNTSREEGLDDLLFDRLVSILWASEQILTDHSHQLGLDQSAQDIVELC